MLPADDAERLGRDWDCVVCDGGVGEAVEVEVVVGVMDDSDRVNSWRWWREAADTGVESDDGCSAVGGGGNEAEGGVGGSEAGMRVLMAVNFACGDGLRLLLLRPGERMRR